MPTLLAVALSLLLLPGSAHAVDESDWLGRINEIRQASGLAPVTENPAWSAGIVAHLDYLAHTPQSYREGGYANAHTENPASPFYTEEGDHEGRSSDLTFASSSNRDAIDVWLAAPLHAIGMLRPGLQQVAFARATPGGAAGLDVISGLSFDPGQPRLVLFPGPGSTIDLSRFGGESPNPIETCETQHAGADYGSAGLPLIALLTEAPAPGSSAYLTAPDGSQVTTDGDDLCLVTADNFTTSDGVYGPTGRGILAGDMAVLVIPRHPLTAGTYGVRIVQPGKSDVAWSFNSAPRPEKTSPSVQPTRLSLLVRKRALRLRADANLTGHVAEVGIRRETVPCALRIAAHRCTWAPSQPPRHEKLRLARSRILRVRPPGPWERVAVHVRTRGFSADSVRFASAQASIVLRGPKPHGVAR